MNRENRENIENEREYRAEYRSFRAIAADRRRKRKKLFLQRLFAAVFCVALLLLGICLFTPSGKAKAESNVQYERRIVSVRVAENDSLWKIAERFYCSEKGSIRDFIDDIKKINHLESDTIYPDTYLVIQYYVKKRP
ncbi:MAG: LysM peptidoglycan-binding domain-containing protein [Lachnospiraceae bacterium]|nr:LysM peptidoglycan-binding domain-containing protein [Lachnospiraceae bacterium]